MEEKLSEVKWIKITTNIFDNEKIQFIEELPEADTIIVIWFKLLTMAGKKNDSGLIYITKDIPYNENMLVKVIKRPYNIIKLALETFIKLNMVEIQNDFIAISNWEKHQNVEGMEKLKEQWRAASKKYRLKQKEKLELTTTSYDGHKMISYDDHTTDKIRLDKTRKEKNKKEKIEYDTNVFLTEEEYEKLITLYGKEKVDDKISDMSAYIINSRPKGYKDCYLALNSWLKKDKEKVKKNSYDYVDTSYL